MWKFIKTVETLLKKKSTIGDATRLGELLRFERVEECLDLLERLVAEEQAALPF